MTESHRPAVIRKDQDKQRELPDSERLPQLHSNCSAVWDAMRKSCVTRDNFVPAFRAGMLLADKADRERASVKLVDYMNVHFPTVATQQYMDPQAYIEGLTYFQSDSKESRESIMMGRFLGLEDGKPKDFDTLSKQSGLPKSAVRRAIRKHIEDFDKLLLSPERMQTLIAQRAGLFYLKAVGFGITFDDLMQVGDLEMLKSLVRYDPKKGKFEVYESVTIDNAFKRYIRDNGTLIRIPREGKDHMSQVRDAIFVLRGQLIKKGEDRAPTDQEIATYTGLEEDDIPMIKVLLQNRASSPAPLIPPPDYDSEEVPEDAVTQGERDPNYEKSLLFFTIKDALQKLPKKHQQVVALRYFYNLRQQDIAEKIGYSQVHISRLLREAHAMLKEIVDPALIY